MADGRSPTPNSVNFQAAKRELLARLLEKEGIELPDSEAIYPRRSAGKTPLSFAQQRLWFLDQLESGKSVYNICRAYRLNGPLDGCALTQSVNEIVCRHEILRTTFPTVNDQPLQEVAPNLTPVIPVLDLEQLPKSIRETEILRILAEEAAKPFNLARGPLWTVTLLRLEKEAHVLLFRAHQIICDGWSISIFFRELETLYREQINGEPANLPELHVQFGDYALWQHESLKRPALVAQLAYWKDRLAGNLTAFELPTDHRRPAIQSFRGARERVEITELMTAALKELGRSNSATLFVTLMAVFNALLYRYTAQPDILIGFPIANRNQPAIHNLIGSFLNTLVLRTDLSGSPTFKQLLLRVRDHCRGAYAHQDLPFEKLVEELQPERDMARNPLFQVMFLFQNSPTADLNLPDITVEAVGVNPNISKFDLTLSLTERGGKLTGFFEYSNDLFERPTIQRMIGHFYTLLDGIVANPEQRISALPLLPGKEKHHLLVEWNDTHADYPKDSCFHELFEAQVEKTPDAIAVESEGKQITYGELNARANQLAHYLRKLGAGPEKLVAICVERSLELVIGLIGILKAGGAYLPLDPAYPKERLAFILEDAPTSVLLTQEKFLGGIFHPRVVSVDRDWGEIIRGSEENPTNNAGAENAAYVLYTSGSTGRPKGVQIAHRSLVNCVWCMRQRLGLTRNDIWLALTTISFDIAALELYLPLITGARVVLASRDEAIDGKQLVDSLTACGATVVQATPSAWKLLLDAGWRGNDSFKVLCGGETLSRELADRLLESGASLWNLYGPTETTIWSTIAKVEASEGPVPIGRPITNTQIYLLDAYLQPVPAGVHGELYIGGDGLARGYLNQRELTAEKFLPNPFKDEPGSRLYRTGDLACYLPDGNIEFLGRTDNQVKIRGYRIELGEIEAALNQHPAVLDSVLVARERASWEEKSLVGYVVLRQQSATSVSELRSFLKEKLPEYTIPAEFVLLDALPRTPNGKIDRNALPLPDGTRPLLTQGFIAPRAEIEELVAQVWREVLKVEEVGVYDNFFDLGGHSLLATRVVARLRNNLSIDLPLRKLFELPTIAALAEHIDFLRRNQSGVRIPPILPASRDRPLPLSFSQRRLWFLHKLDPNLTAYNIPAVFRITGTLNIPVLEQALNEIVARHEILRTRVVEVDGQPLQEIVSPLNLTLPVTDLTPLSEDESAAEARRLAIDDARAPFALQEAPLMRAKLLRLKDREHLLFLNFHHLVCDGSSLVIFYQELAALYEAFLYNKPSPLVPLPVQYADYAVWQQEWIETEVLESQLAHWKRRLGDQSMTLKLPADHERPAVQSFRGARLIEALSEDLTKALKDLSRREGVTLFMTLLAALNILLYRYTGQKHIIVGSTVAGRNRSEIEGLIGFFINALVLRTDLSGDPSFSELLERVREVCLGAYTHQDLPFEKIVEAVNPERDLSRNPLFQVLFNMVDISERVLDICGCEVTRALLVDPQAKFDITLYAPEKDGRIELAVGYNTDLFSESRIAVMLEQFHWLLAQIAERPEERIAAYNLVSPSRQGLLPDPTESLDDFWEGAIHDLVAKQAKRTPERLAVVDPNTAWTYGELDTRSNQLAHCLLAQGIQPKDVVAIYADRSSSFVLALLGVLKAGAAFVILDPAYPYPRLIDYLSIARPRGWVKMEAAGDLSEALLSCLDGLQLRSRINLPSSNKDIADYLGEYSETETGTVINANDPAYVAFTSGSTGEPKGVLCRHGPITHFLPWQEETFDLKESDRFSLLSGLAYNHLQRDVFTALALGATLYVPALEHLKSPEPLVQWLQKTEITILHLTPALGQLLLTASEKSLPSVRRIFFGGDVLTRQEVAKIRELAPNARVGSFYGATETQRAVGYYEITEDLPFSGDDARRAIPLGRGIKDVQLLLLNSRNRLAGVGELGVLHLRSPHLAEGYIGDEKLTGEVFVTNPFTNNPSDRLYRSGEIGRYLPDGNVEWAGRSDRGVNIRGFRVELGEVESVLHGHPAVSDAAVVAKEFVADDSARNTLADLRLVAYVVAEEGEQSLVDLLRSFLSARLPDYMVPAHFIFLDHLPLSPNGKVDYRALPAPDQRARPAEDRFASPRTEVEQALAKILSQVLGLEQISRHDNFFHLGGHSLLAAQAAERIRETLHVALDLRAFLETPTVEGLARRVEVLRGDPLTRDSQANEREEIEL
jgi:amino acid adenylation domain-containing protein